MLSEYKLAVIHKYGKQICHVDYFTRHTADLEHDPVEDRMCYPIPVDSNSISSIEEIVQQQQIEEIAIYKDKKGFYTKDEIIYY